MPVIQFGKCRQSTLAKLTCKHTSLCYVVFTRSTLSSEHFQADSGQAVAKLTQKPLLVNSFANVTSLANMLCNCTMLLSPCALAQIVKLVGKKMATKKIETPK